MSSEQRAIADYFLEQARWRDERAAEHPEDHRNSQSAAGLSELAKYVLALPDDDERIIDLTTLATREGVFMPFQEGSRITGRFRFGRPDQDCGAFLGELVRQTHRDALDFAREHGAIEGSE
jgi:hypothetical protein